MTCRPLLAIATTASSPAPRLGPRSAGNLAYHQASHDPPRPAQPSEQAHLVDIRARCPHINALARHTAPFAEMMTARTGSREPRGLARRRRGRQSARAPLPASGIRNDIQAVTNGLTLLYSSGKVEGTVKEIKTIKRPMYGCARFGLLRKRVIVHLRNRRHGICGRAKSGGRQPGCHQAANPDLPMAVDIQGPSRTPRLREDCRALPGRPAGWRGDRATARHGPAVRPPGAGRSSKTAVSASRDAPPPAVHHPVTSRARLA
jgi:hypothetical protein